MDDMEVKLFRTLDNARIAAQNTSECTRQHNVIPSSEGS